MADFPCEPQGKGNSPLADFLHKKTGVDSQHCYQCGKCSAGCPLACEMDLPPSVIMRLLQTRDSRFTDEILRSHSIWLCLSCEICYVRCPMEIDIPMVMDALRAEAMKRKVVHPRAKKIIAFHRSFLDSIRYTGRLYEVGLIAGYKARSGSMLQDLLLAPLMFIRGKLHIIPELIKGRPVMKRIFSRTIRGRGK